MSPKELKKNPVILDSRFCVDSIISFRAAGHASCNLARALRDSLVTGRGDSAAVDI